MSTEHLHGKSILVTGGTGTFGRAIIRRLLAIPQIRKLAVLSRDEYKQGEMMHELEYQDPRITFFIGDVRDKARLHRAFNNVDIVVHAAALKQVPALEYNPAEALETNVTGTRNVIEAALDRNVPRVLLISTDKAVQPINLYGATKMCAERLAIAANSYRGAHGQTRISAIRYGNVLGSRGSIVEIIEKQRPSGVITLTDDRMTRFWIHIDAVIDRVFQALAVMDGGEVFVPKMFSTRVADLLKSLAPECSFKIIGIRPGEKLHETIITEYEAKRTRDLGELFVIEPEFENWGRQDPLAQYPLLPEGVVYSSDNVEYMLGLDRIGEITKKPISPHK